jgi:hypothetical protein
MLLGMHKELFLREYANQRGVWCASQGFQVRNDESGHTVHVSPQGMYGVVVTAAVDAPRMLIVLHASDTETSHKDAAHTWSYTSMCTRAWQSRAERHALTRKVPHACRCSGGGAGAGSDASQPPARGVGGECAPHAWPVKAAAAQRIIHVCALCGARAYVAAR